MVAELAARDGEERLRVAQVVRPEGVFEPQREVGAAVDHALCNLVVDGEARVLAVGDHVGVLDNLLGNLLREALVLGARAEVAVLLRGLGGRRDVRVRAPFAALHPDPGVVPTPAATRGAAPPTASAACAAAAAATVYNNVLLEDEAVVVDQVLHPQRKLHGVRVVVDICLVRVRQRVVWKQRLAEPLEGEERHAQHGGHHVVQHQQLPVDALAHGIVEPPRDRADREAVVAQRVHRAAQGLVKGVGLGDFEREPRHGVVGDMAAVVALARALERLAEAYAHEAVE